MTTPGLSRLFWACAPVVFVLFWAGGYSFAKLGLPHIEPMTMLAVRYGLAVLCLLPLLAIYRPALPRDATHWLLMALSGFLIQCVYFGLAYLAMKQGLAAGTTAIIMALQPALVAALAPLVAEPRGRPVMWVGLGLGFAGVALSVLDNTGNQGVPLSAGLLALGALAGISAATLLEKAHGRRTDPILGGVVQYAVGVCVLTPIALWSETQVINWHPNLIISLAYLIIANSLISISLYVALVQRGNMTQVSTLMYLVPPLALMLAWGLLGEPITLHTVIGFGLCLLGVYIVSRSKVGINHP
ncbi:DMT family transporter (plasmid) [Rhodobacteraceae bacterium M382]|nr:DMT family transporter [Rhodobacteraceae bacterium M382]